MLTNEYEKLYGGKGEPSGEYCYCRIDSPASSDWVLATTDRKDLDDCTNYCVKSISGYNGGESSADMFVKSMFATVRGGTSGMGAQVPTSKYYVETELAKLQDKFVSQGGKPILMTYSNTAGNPSGRAISNHVDDTNADIPERGAIVEELNTKQNTVTGTANWVVTYGQSGGSFQSKPIYNTVNTNYTTALVDAQTLNNAIIQAANSEFTPVENVGFRINSVQDMPLLSTQAQ